MGTESQPLSEEVAFGRLAPLIGLPVSRLWLGYGAALFLELGELLKRGGERGETTVMLDCDWILGGTGLGLVHRDTPDHIVTEEVHRLKGRRVISVQLTPIDLSLTLGFERGQWIRASGRHWDENSWTVFLSDDWWITVENNQLVLQRGIETVHDGAV